MLNKISDDAISWLIAIVCSFLPSKDIRGRFSLAKRERKIYKHETQFRIKPRMKYNCE